MKNKYKELENQIRKLLQIKIISAKEIDNKIKDLVLDNGLEELTLKKDDGEIGAIIVFKNNKPVFKIITEYGESNEDIQNFLKNF